VPRSASQSTVCVSLPSRWSYNNILRRIASKTPNSKPPPAAGRYDYPSILSQTKPTRDETGTFICSKYYCNCRETEVYQRSRYFSISCMHEYRVLQRETQIRFTEKYPPRNLL